jgi:hypothetical protein
MSYIDVKRLSPVEKAFLVETIRARVLTESQNYGCHRIGIAVPTYVHWRQKLDCAGGNAELAFGGPLRKGGRPRTVDRATRETRRKAKRLAALARRAEEALEKMRTLWPEIPEDARTETAGGWPEAVRKALLNP